ncbi:hypothetical protein LG275_03680 [Chryseomicrobium palamuruense]
MTIVSCVYVPEGIAMAADSRLTNTISSNGSEKVTYTLTDNAQKLMLIRDGTIGVSFSGTAILDGKTTADFIREFDISLPNASYNIPHVAHLLHEFIKSKSLNATFKLCGYENDEPYVYDVTLEAPSRLNIDGTGSIAYGATWAGEITLPNRLFNNHMVNFNFLPLKDAHDLAHLIVDVTKKFTRFEDRISTVGGPIDTLVITKDYTKFIKHKILSP